MLSTLSYVQLFVTPWTAAHQAPLSIGFSRPEYWSGLPCSPPGDLPNPGIEPRSPTLQADSLPSEPPGKPKNTVVDSLSLLQGIFQPRNQTGLSCIAGGFFTGWATREAWSYNYHHPKKIPKSWAIASHITVFKSSSGNKHFSLIQIDEPFLDSEK